MSVAEQFLAVGLMSGTSMDGIDAVLISISEDPLEIKTVESVHVPYTVEIKRELFELIRGEKSLKEISMANVAIGELHGIATNALLKKADVSPEDVAVAGFHGQTILHQPDAARMMGRIVRSSFQLGCPSSVAEISGLNVVSNFRARDIAAGGQGAPLVPFFDYAIHTHEKKNRVILNIGGIANVTMIPAGAHPFQVLAFDTGPGNSLIDLATSVFTNGEQDYDQDGKIAASGETDQATLKMLMKHPFLDQEPPKSTGREVFGLDFLKKIVGSRKIDENLICTLTEYTAASIARAIKEFWRLHKAPEEIIVSGGGVFNKTLMRFLNSYTTGSKLKTSDEFGISPVFKEAIAFAYLAYRTIKKEPGNLPSATGAERPVILGQVTYK